jgi:hypothetical protein
MLTVPLNVRAGVSQLAFTLEHCDAKVRPCRTCASLCDNMRVEANGNMDQEGDFVAVLEAGFPESCRGCPRLLLQALEGQNPPSLSANEKNGLAPRFGHPIDRFLDNGLFTAQLFLGIVTF